MIGHWQKCLGLVLLGLVLAGCSEFVWPDQPRLDETRVVELTAGETVGQTIFAREAGLQGIDVYLSPAAPQAGEVQLHLRASPLATEDLATARVALSHIVSPAFYRFAFAPLTDSHHKSYYMFLEMIGPGSVRVGNAGLEAYADGALYQAGQPAEAQMTFRLAYEPAHVLLAVAGEMVTWVGLLGIAMLVFVVPGWALLLFWPAARNLAWPVQLGLAISLSLALYPLLLLWPFLVKWSLGGLYAWIPLVGGLMVLLWQAWRARFWGGWRTLWSSWAHSENLWPDLALIGVVGLIFWSRFWVIRALEVPLWGDSYHHTLIAQLLVDNGGLFNSWEPYADMQTFTYHFGFHSYVAVWHWVTGTGLPRATLWIGQLLNGLAALALYPLAFRVGRNRWAGVGAVLVAGLLSPMPMTYVNWGRYTQLAGQVILPGAIYLAWAALEARHTERYLITLGWVVFGGIALTHYRILVWVALFPMALFLFEGWRVGFKILIVRLFWLSIGSVLLFLPWFVHMFAGRILESLVGRLSTPAVEVSSGTQEYNAIGNLLNYLPSYLWVLLLIGVVWGLWKRQRDMGVVCLWWSLILLATNPHWLNLPGTGIISNFALFIAAYLPAGVVLGAAMGWLMEHRLPSRRWGAALLLVVVGVGMWQARQRLGDIRVTEHALVTRPDVRASQWIEANTPTEARLLVNSFFAYGNFVIVGSDGGWWLPLLAHRSTTLPPIVYTSERGPRPDYREWTNLLTAELAAKGVDHPDVLSLLNQRGVTHVYIGQRQGSVNYSGPNVFHPEQLLMSSHYRPVYHQDQVWVFELIP